LGEQFAHSPNSGTLEAFSSRNLTSARRPRGSAFVDVGLVRSALDMLEAQRLNVFKDR